VNVTQRLLDMTNALSRATSLEQTLQVVVDTCAELLSTTRMSLRLFDPTHTRLIATARAGQPLHRNATYDYQRGEGLIGWVAEHAQPIRANDAEADPRFQQRADMVDRMGSFLGAPVIHDGKVIGVLAAVHQVKDAFTPEHEQLVLLIAGICAPHVEVARLERLAQVDVLTGAFNRRGLDLCFPEATRRKLSVAMIDIDHFKRINDELGHGAGDVCLKKLARLLFDSMRAEDSVIRLGGEEFLLVLPGSDLHEGQQIAERVRAAVEATPLIDERRVTISVGVAQHKLGDSREETILRADQALYSAKQRGRNQVVAG
jgi:diguanylate cyclase (GGDEF)-like protein